MAIVAYNARRVLLAAMYDVHEQQAVDNLSELRVSVEVTRHIEGLYIAIAIDQEQWSQLIGDGSKSLARFLRRVARTMDPKRYKKATRGLKRPPSKKKKMQRNSHLSAQKLLNQRKKETR